MNSKRKKKIAAAAMAFTSIFGVENSSAVPKSGDIAIHENSDEQNLSQSETKIKKESEKSQDTSNVPLLACTLAVLAGISLITYTAWSNNKKTDVDNDNTDDNESNKHNNPSDNLNKKDVKKVWENDPERIIKFIKWLGKPKYPMGSCIVNSYFNMFLNPIIVDYLKNARNSNLKFMNQYWVDKISALEDIWEASKKHEFIERNEQNERVYDNASSIFKCLVNDAPDLIGTLGMGGTIAKSMQQMQDGIKDNQCPTLVFCGLTESYGYNNSQSVLQNPDLNKASYTLPNGRSYFVGGATLTCGRHTVFAHLLYSDDGTKLERVIIQDPNGSSNGKPQNYVKELEIGRMQDLLKGDFYGSYHIDKLLMIRDDKFMESKYWKNSSLDGDIVSKF